MWRIRSSLHQGCDGLGGRTSAVDIHDDAWWFGWRGEDRGVVILLCNRKGASPASVAFCGATIHKGLTSILSSQSLYLKHSALKPCRGGNSWKTMTNYDTLMICHAQNITQATSSCTRGLPSEQRRPCRLQYHCQPWNPKRGTRRFRKWAGWSC